MTTPPVCPAYVINLICTRRVHRGYGTLLITLESDVLLSLGLDRLSPQLICFHYDPDMSVLSIISQFVSSLISPTGREPRSELLEFI